MLDQVTAALAALETNGTFATELACGSDDLHVEVEGVGPIGFPIAAATARKLCAVARPAPFGLRDRTLHDTRVRDSWEIGKGKIKIDGRAWRRTLGPQLAILRDLLGLPEGGKLEVVLDKMLVYGPGQFFAPHQDSERADAMVGSLVVVLPSKHAGGEVVVQHHQEKRVLGEAPGGPKDLALLAFYADCHHEVKPVASGYRITLTYHLLYRGPARASAPLCPAAVDRVVTSVNAYFATPVAERYARSAPERPERLVYLLDHDYTEKSLGWDHLKNADVRRAEALRQAAERLDAEVFLALADVHESWSCDEDWGGRYGRRRRYWEEESGDEQDANAYTLTDLISSDVELRHWVAPDGRASPGVPVRPRDTEICFTRASAELDPFKSEHEGYMGNYGNTVDRWYHRAALVMWPRERSFVLRARASPSWAVKQVAADLKTGAVDAARAKAKQVLPFWSSSAPRETSATFAAQLFTVAASLDGDLAFGLVSPLGPHRLSGRATAAFVALVELHGLAWGKRVFTAWAGNHRYDTPRWLPSLPALGAALAAGGEQGAALAAWLLAREVATLEKRLAGARRLPEAILDDGMAGEIDDLVALLEAAATLQAAEIRDGLVAYLAAPKTALPLLPGGALLQKLRKDRAPAEVRALGVGALARHIAGQLERAVAARPRSLDDWSIEPPSGCGCELCQTLAAFLQDPERMRLAWPLAKERRRHIHGVLDRNRLPVTHVTLRQGSPQTLVLTKQPELFERDDALRARQKALLAWLRKEARAFGV